LTRTEHTLAIILSRCSRGRFFPSIHVWVWLSARHGAGCRSFCAPFPLLHGACDAVCRCDGGDPDDFLRVPLSAAAGWLIYSERLDMFTVLGACLILAGNLLNLKVAGPVPARVPS
jgi:drug/metabolite transporter (DMT)-like permease